MQASCRHVDFALSAIFFKAFKCDAVRIFWAGDYRIVVIGFINEDQLEEIFVAASSTEQGLLDQAFKFKQGLDNVTPSL